MLILFFDTYITDGTGDKGGAFNSSLMISELSKIRESCFSYRWQEKIDVVKYTLDSYSKINWDRVIIRFVCEDPSQTESFISYCRKIFPSSEIYNERSDTALKYYEALSSLNESDDSWIFFSPNNDHPYLADPKELGQYLSFADKIAKKYPENEISLLYSHFTESMNDNYMSDPQWGYFGLRFKKVIYEDEKVVVSKSNKAALDSCHIFKLGFLRNIFLSTKNTGRVIRLEDTEYYLSPKHNLIQICPKVELCRHYDSYAHIIQYVPPLFIPEGFFAKQIKIRYGYAEAINGWISINPAAEYVGNNVDLPLILDDIAFFWKDKIIEVDSNKSFNKNIKKTESIYYKNFLNPWHRRSRLINYLRSFYIFALLQSWALLRYLIKLMFIKVGLFNFARKIKRLLLPDTV